MKKLFFGFLSVLVLMPSLAFAAAPHFQVDTGGTLTTGLVSYYPLEGNSNDFFDSNNGTDSGTPTYSTGNGKVNDGVGAFSAGGKISLGSPSSLNISSDFSIAGWVRFADITAGATTIYARENVGTYTQVIILKKQAGTGNLETLIIKDGVEYDCATSDTPIASSGTWYFIVATFESNACHSILVNNSAHTLSKTFGTFTNLPTADVTIALFGENYASFTGTSAADEWGIWNKILSSTEATDLYNAGAGQTMTTSTLPVVPVSPRLTSLDQNFVNFLASYQATIFWIGIFILFGAFARGLAYILQVIYSHYKDKYHV